MKIPVSRRESKLAKFRPFAPPMPLATPLEALAYHPEDLRDDLLVSSIALFRGAAGARCFEKLASRLQLGLGHATGFDQLNVLFAAIKGGKS